MLKKRCSRREVLKALGLAAIIGPASAPAPARLPFKPTGWKTVLLDHLSCTVADYPKEAAFYAALMNWNIRADDGTQASLDIGDWGGLNLRGGYQAPSAGAVRSRLAECDGFSWGIEPWDAKAVEAELRTRGLSPVADHRSDGYQSFHVKDPNGFNLQITNANPKNRRQGSGRATTSAPMPFAPTNWKTVWLDHISFEVSNYKDIVAFYTALLGWTPGMDEGSQNRCQIGDVGGIIIRRGRAGAGARRATIDHVAFGIMPFDPDRVKTELEKRGLAARVDTNGGGDIHTAWYKSYHTVTPNGFDLQISGTRV